MRDPMRYGYEPGTRTDPEVLWDDPTWRRADEASRLDLRRSSLVQLESEEGRSGSGSIGALLVVGAALLGMAAAPKKRR